MREPRKRRWGVVGLMLGMLLGNSAPQAHPHHWIDVFTEWQFGPKGVISGVKLRWLFDDYYSVLLADDAAATGKDLQELLEDILSNTARHDYFLQVEQKGTEASLGAAERARIGVRDHRIEVEFHLPITVPLDSQHGDVVYQVAEPSYYFEMLHAEEGPAIVLKDTPSGCRYHVEPPKPDAALVAYAASLGINESGGDELGIQFAEPQPRAW
jgi:ABC-type uncharacterized transport system substrate-binding protein